MEWHQSNDIQFSNSDIEALDVKPLKTLAPMFPSANGITAFSITDNDPFVFVSTTRASLPSNDLMPPKPAFSSFTTPSKSPEILAEILADDSDYEEEEVFHSNHISSSGRKIKQPIRLGGCKVESVAEPRSGSGSGSVTNGKFTAQLKPLKKRAKVENHNSMVLIPSPSDPKEAVDVVLMAFDALRRKIAQLEDGKEVRSSQPNLKAGNILMSNDIKANRGKRIGPVAGVEIGDMFYFRMELCLVGVHAPVMGGIDYMTSNFNDGDDTVAISVVSSGGYEDEDNNVNSLIYTGQGDQHSNQKLERGNLAMERSLHRGILVRVVRSARDYGIVSGKIYYYDGLYKIEESWVEKGKAGFKVFKFKLVRQLNQPHGLAIWKMTQQWKDNNQTRGKVILSDLSSGIESLPVCLVNEIDDEKGPKHFKYSNKVEYLLSVNSMKPLEICQCLSICLPGDTDCLCAKKNDGYLPYSPSGTLVSRKPLIYECNGSCCCSTSCRNRATQKGSKLQFEVFMTQDRGWGLRSWDPIRAGTFICEYTGEVTNKVNFKSETDEDEDYIFQPLGIDENAFKWNYGPELIGEPSTNYSNAALGSLPIIISAKKIGNISRFMNHSCAPNVFWQPVLYDHGDEEYPHIMFFAVKHIPPMTELTYDYGMSGETRFRKIKKCLCASPQCRGFFG